VRSALDFACGTGRVLGYLESRVPVTFGVDISAEMVELARPRCGRSRFYLQDVLQPPRADLPADLDLITAFRFFLNAEPELRRAALRFMHGRLRPTGALVANFHLNPLSLRGRYLRARWHGRRREPMLSPADVERLLAAERFEPVAWYGYEYLPYRRAGERMIAPRLRRQVETWLLDRTAVRGHAGSFLVVARPR
jgi:SAM-dependent methyltransferase